MKTELFDDQGQTRGFFSSLNRLNDLTGREWKYWTRSVINKSYPPDFQHSLRKNHGGQKPPKLCADLIQIFSKKGQKILDPFMGVGGVLIGASISDRIAVGIDFNPKWIEIYKKVCRLEGLLEMETYEGDSKELLRSVKGPFDMIFTDVPYWKMDLVPHSTGVYKRVGEKSYQAPSSNLSQFSSYGYADKTDWLDTMEQIFTLAVDHLKKGGYLLSFIGDMYVEGGYHCLSAELANRLSNITSIEWQANLIWYDVSKKLHIYGYQYRYIPSFIHQNILVFRKKD